MKNNKVRPENKEAVSQVLVVPGLDVRDVLQPPPGHDLVQFPCLFPGPRDCHQKEEIQVKVSTC